MDNAHIIMGAKYPNSPLAKLLSEETPKIEENEEKKSDVISLECRSTSPVSTSRPSKFTSKACRDCHYVPDRIEPVVRDIILPPGCSHNYPLWTRKEVAMFFNGFLDKVDTEYVLKGYRISGTNLYYCFLHSETSEAWRRKRKIREGLMTKIRMTLGNIHNQFYCL